MSPTFHPSEQLLTDYAVGDLPLAPGLVVSAHLEGCRRCRSRVRDAEEAEGRRLIEAEPAALSMDALAATLKRLSAAPEPEPNAPAAATQLGDVELPGAAARIGVRRRRYLGPGLWSARVDHAAKDDWRTVVLRVPAGTTVPSHGHSGEEVIAVLAGSFSDGREYSAGDFVASGAGRDHDLKVMGDEPCACLIAIRGRLLWKGWSQVVGLALGL